MAQPALVAPPRPEAGPDPQEIRELWHYHASYPYTPDIYQYSDWHTTDPYYQQDGVKLITSEIHSRYARLTVCNLQVYQDQAPTVVALQCHQELTVGHLQEPLQHLQACLYDVSPLPEPARTTVKQFVRAIPDEAWPHVIQAFAKVAVRRAVTPDVMLYEAATPLPVTGDVSWPESGPPLMVIEFLSRSTADKDLYVNPLLYYLIGVEEYWICDPLTPGIRHVWTRTADGDWIDERAPEAPHYSRVLRTWVRMDAPAGFQCYDAHAQAWVDGDPVKAKAEARAARQEAQAAREEVQAAQEEVQEREIAVLANLVMALYGEAYARSDFVQGLRQRPQADFPTPQDILRRLDDGLPPLEGMTRIT